VAIRGIAFEWDRRKSTSNVRKHGVSFTEASTVFDDPFSITIPDPDYSGEEERFVIIGASAKLELLVVVESASSAPALLRSMKDGTMKKATTSSKASTKEMREQYDFSGGVRGKYVERYRAGTNVVLLDPELVEAFPDSKSVNDALRALVAIAHRRKSRKRAR